MDPQPPESSAIDARASAEPQEKPFPYHLPLDQQQAALAAVPLTLFFPGVAALAGAVGFAGMQLVKAAPVEHEAKDLAAYAVAAVGAAAVGVAGVQAKKKRDSAAVVVLYNKIVDLPDPCDLAPETVKQVGSEFGIDMHRDDMDGLTKIYGQYLEALIPTGDTQLRGDEAPKVMAFKEALGLNDEEAAPVHIEVARRLFRQGYETKDRNLMFEQRKAFQRLIYVSQLVFGDQKAAYLLPWRRLFNITDAQVFVARRDNARTIFRAYLEQQGGDLPADRHFLRSLREHQQAVKMLDETAVEVVKEASRKHVEVLLEKAVTVLKATAKTRDPNLVLGPIQEALEYSRKLDKYSNEEDLIPGLAPVSLAGGALAQEARQRDLKDLYKAFVEERMERVEAFDAELEADARDLQAMLGLSASAAQMLQDEVAARLYKKLLRAEVASGRLDQSDSPAQLLGSLCDRVRFSPEAALELHKSLYKTKLMTLVGEGRALSEGEVQDLARIRRILCLPAEVARKAQRETAGKVLEEAISDIYMMGAKPIIDTEAERVDKVIKDLRIESDVAMDVFKEVTRERLRAYVQQALKERGSNQDRRASAAALKKLVQFNVIVVTPLLERMSGQTPSDEERHGQKEITLRDDVSPENRALLYKDYLMSVMMADAVELPVGGVFRRKSSQMNRQADMTRLQVLADLMGMSQAEVVAVQAEMAEQAFKGQAQEVMRSGPVTDDKAAYLDEMRVQLNLSKEQADKIIKAARTEVLGAQAAIEDGKWTIERVLDVTRKGGNVEALAEEVTRRNLYRKEFERAIADGTGDLDAAYLLEELPRILALDERKVKMIAKELAGSKRRMLLVQAISQLRQRRTSETTSSLLNLLSCTRALPGNEAPMQWTERGEIRDIYAIFCARVPDESKRAELAKVLGLSAEEAAASSVPTASAAAQPVEEESFF